MTIAPRYTPPPRTEREVYPNGLRIENIRMLIVSASIGLDSYERFSKGCDVNSAEYLDSIGTMSQLILDASGRLASYNQKDLSSVHDASNLIGVYSPLFPEINVQDIRRVDQLAPLFAERTRELGQSMSNPERLSPEERRDLVHKLVTISNSINRQQHRQS